MSIDPSLEEALAKLDRDIAETEARLQELQLARRGAEALLDYMGAGTKKRRTSEPSAPTSGLSGQVLEAIRSLWSEGIPQVDTTMVYLRLQQTGQELDREQVRNSMTYLARSNVLERTGQRGRWQLVESEAPVGAGASVTALDGHGEEVTPHAPDDPHKNQDHLFLPGRDSDRDRVEGDDVVADPPA